MMSMRVQVTEAGQLSLPAELRRAVGLERGGEVIVDLAGREIRIRTVNEVVVRAQELSRRLLAGKPVASVDDFLAERRAEAGSE